MSGKKLFSMNCIIWHESQTNVFDGDWTMEWETIPLNTAPHFVIIYKPISLWHKDMHL